MRWSELSFNYVEWVATKSSLGDEFKDFASAELEHRNEALEGMKAETVVGKVIGVDDPVAYNEAVEKNRQDMVDKAKARNRTDDAMEQVDGLIGDLKKAGKPTKAKKVSKKNKYTKDYAEKVVAKLEKKSEEKVKKTKAPTPEPEQLSWDEIKEESAKTLDG
jgi:hypothetical protein